MVDPLQGIDADQRDELSAILQRLGRLWADLTKAATELDLSRAEAIHREIANADSGSRRSSGPGRSGRHEHRALDHARPLRPIAYRALGFGFLPRRAVPGPLPGS